MDCENGGRDPGPTDWLKERRAGVGVSMWLLNLRATGVTGVWSAAVVVVVAPESTLMAREVGRKIPEPGMLVVK